MPFDPRTGTFIFGKQRAPAAQSGYGTDRATGLGGWHEPADKRSQRYVGGSLLPAERGNEQRAAEAWGNYSGALNDIEGTVGRFGDIYQKAGRAIADPAMRDFDQTLARTGANVASRFGGNVSSEELRQGYNTSDLFTRNLGEALARMGGDQVNAGLNYTGQLGQAAGQSADERDRLRQLILQGISQGRVRQPKKGPLDYLGAAAGAAAAFL